MSSVASVQRTGSAISSLSATSDGQMESQLNEWTRDHDEHHEQDEENVAVMVRCRPPRTNTKRAEQQQVEVDEENNCVQLQLDQAVGSTSSNANNERQVREFYFDRVFGERATNDLVYMQSARKLVESSFAGYNCTIFLYGQTGTGKTHTHSALVSSAFEHLFSLIKLSNQEARFLIRASYYELYNEEIRDLLSPVRPARALELRETRTRGVYISDLSCFLVNNPAELERLKRLGDKRRATAATKMNDHSSRSHSIFSITIETKTSVAGETASNTKEANVNKHRANLGGKNEAPMQQAAGKQVVRLGRLHLIDLAGSERQAKSGSSGARLKEASRINLSLTCLSLVIRALTDPSSVHIPYRNSKLTRLLSSSLGGNSKTLLVACIAPESENLDETLNTLRFASRTKRIKNRAKINEDPKDALLRKYKKQVDELKRKLVGVSQQEFLHANENGNDTQQSRLLNGENGQPDDSTRKQLELLKAKIMVGGENLLDKVELHERLLEASRAELEEKRQREMRLREQLDEKRKRLELVEHTKGSLEGERQQLESRLKRAVTLYKRSKLERRDLVSEHEQLKDSLLQGIKATSREIKYVDCILEDFIPREHLDLISAYAQYDDESDEWQIKYIAMSGNNIVQASQRGLTQTKRDNSLGCSSTSSSATSSTLEAEQTK